MAAATRRHRYCAHERLPPALLFAHAHYIRWMSSVSGDVEAQRRRKAHAPFARLRLHHVEASISSVSSFTPTTSSNSAQNAIPLAPVSTPLASISTKRRGRDVETAVTLIEDEDFHPSAPQQRARLRPGPVLHS
ncbi:hypothetical protein R3P38DRAFT_3220720 [Favolaschia claudopus]|uniref:Uncharacterized protein n=1 Tax=Favolaschia claudopus TaxID=2862362 RepID=A0AAW0A182_9AGAR